MVPFTPVASDIYDARTILASRKLPNELVLTILGYARYWVEFERGRTQFMVLMDEDFSLDYSAAHPYYTLAAFPPRIEADDEVQKIREVEFLVVGHGKLESPTGRKYYTTTITIYRSRLDWTTEDTRGTYQISSWFEGSILRPRKLNRFMTIDQSDPPTLQFIQQVRWSSCHDPL